MRATYAAAAATVAGVLLLGACSSDSSFLLDDEYVDMPLCARQDEPVDVTDLHLKKYATCNLEGLQLRFPTGDVVEIPAVAVNSGLQTEDYVLGYINLGLDGMLASYVDDSETRVWGPPQTVDMALEKPAAWHYRR
jgi:hypothetical protein